MKKYYFGLILLIIAAAIFGKQQYTNYKKQEFIEASTTVIKRLANELKTELSNAIQNEGIGSAIQTCKLRAPEIAQEISADSSLLIKRTSLKLRNPENAPDEWEKKSLTLLEHMLAQGTPISDLTVTEIERSNSKKIYRHMRAIPTQPICLNCHGDEKILSPEVKNMLKDTYPSDRAIGFQVGDIRGAFSVIKTLEN